MSVASKNLFDLLGNDDGDSDTPSAPVKTVDKNTMRSSKRNVEPVAPTRPAGASTGARRGPGGNEGAFRDKNAGSERNHRRGTDEPARGGPRGGRGARERGGRGGRFPRDRDERHSKGLPHGGSEKTAAQTWGAPEGEAEQKDEQAGEQIAQTEIKEAVAEDAENPETPAEPENKSISYADYLAQQAEKKLALGEDLAIRKPDGKVDKKWANAKPLEHEVEDFMAASGGKAKRERERKQKQFVEIDNRYHEPERTRGGRGGRGGFRGGNRGGRGDGREPRGEGRGEGRGEHRGDHRGEHRGEHRGDHRGARGGHGAASLNTKDEAAFPSLGA